MSAKFRNAIDPREFVYPANLLTLARLLMPPAAIRYLHQPNGHWRALGILGIAMLTDALDGPIARRRQEVSPLGKVLDPLAGKIMIDATAITLSRTRGFPWWATGLLLARDLGIVRVGADLPSPREITIAHPSGKATTLALTATMLLYIADGPRSGRPAFYLSMIPFLYSISHYLRAFRSFLR